MLRFSVVIPCHDPDPEQLEFCLTSVRSQLSPRDHQILLIDDQSADPSVCAGAADRFGVTLVRTDREVFGNVAANIGIERADGDLVHVIHGDDAVLQGFYAAVSHAAGSHPSRALVVTDHLECDEFCRPFHAPRIDWLGGGGRAFRPLHEGNPLAVAACVIRRDWLAGHGGWDDRLKHTSDWHLFARATTLGGAVRVEWPLALYRHHPANHTARTRRSADNLRDYLRLAGLCAEFMPVDRAKFNDYVAMRAARQAEMFRRVGDVEAVKANEAFLRELAGGAA